MTKTRQRSGGRFTATLFLGLAVVWAFAPWAGATDITLGPPPGKWSPEVRAILTQMAQQFVAANPSTTVSVSPDSDSFTASAASATAMGDVLFFTGVSYGQGSLLAACAAQGLLVPLDDFVSSSAVQKSDFFPNLWDMVTYQGQTWGVPLLVRSWGVGVDPTQCDPTTIQPQLASWGAFGRMLPSLMVDTDGDGIPDSSLIRATTSPIVVWEALFLAAGGDPNDPASFNPTSASWQQATQAFTQMLQANPLWLERPAVLTGLNPTDPDPVQFVHNDPGGMGSLPILRRVQPQWVLLPAPGSAPLPPLDTTVVAIRHSTPDREAQAKAFVAWLVSPSTMSTVYPAYSLTPLRLSVALASKDPDTQTFAKQLQRMKFQQLLANDTPQRQALVNQLKTAFSVTGASM